MLHVSINSGGSATYGYAQQAAAQLAEERPDCRMKIHLVDSHTYSMVFGYYLCECARKLRNGGELQSCIAELEHKYACVEACLAAYSLKQMKKSGRVSAAAALRASCWACAGHQPERRHQPLWRPRSAATRLCPPLC